MLTLKDKENIDDFYQVILKIKSPLNGGSFQWKQINFHRINWLIQCPRVNMIMWNDFREAMKWIITDELFLHKTITRIFPIHYYLKEIHRWVISKYKQQRSCY